MDEWLTGAIEALTDSTKRTELLEHERLERERLPDLIREALGAEGSS